jgi:hypothetical protein
MSDQQDQHDQQQHNNVEQPVDDVQDENIPQEEDNQNGDVEEAPVESPMPEEDYEDSPGLAVNGEYQGDPVEEGHECE